jgi:hypothetical protein
MYLTRQFEIGRLPVHPDSCDDDLSKLVEREFALNPIYSVPLAIDDPWSYSTTADLPSHPQTRHLFSFAGWDEFHFGSLESDFESHSVYTRVITGAGSPHLVMWVEMGKLSESAFQVTQA